MKEFTEEQKDLLGKPTITILPSFNGEWVIEVHSQEGELFGRFNAVDVDMAVGAIRAAMIDDEPPHFDIN